MNFIEATSSGRDFRHPDMREGKYLGFKGEELAIFVNGKGGNPQLVLKDFTREDYEFVEEEIEVGDVVECIICHDSKCEVDSLGEKLTRLHRIEGDSEFDCTCLKEKSMLHLIRKGKTHVFEGVQWAENGFIYPHRGISNPMYNELKKVLGKTYTMTLREE
jgi:hypothetical protein